MFQGERERERDRMFILTLFISDTRNPLSQFLLIIKMLPLTIVGILVHLVLSNSLIQTQIPSSCGYHFLLQCGRPHPSCPRRTLPYHPPAIMSDHAHGAKARVHQACFPTLISDRTKFRCNEASARPSRMIVVVVVLLSEKMRILN